MAPIKESGLSLMKKCQYKMVFRDPQSILKKKFGDDMSVVDYKSESFSKVGDNYGSTMMNIRISIRRNPKDKIEELTLIGKMLPQSDYQRMMFENDYTFEKEIFAYKQLLPMYQEIYKKELNIVPSYYGSRISYEPETGKVNEDSVLLLENLKVKDYYIQDRRKGLDMEHLNILIPTVAKFHGIGLALKHKNPSFWPILEKYKRPLTMAVRKHFREKTLRNVENHPVVNQYWPRIENVMKKLKETPNVMKLDDPWACVAHLDLWNNNVIFHRNKAGKVDDVKLVDFQTYTVTSPLADLIFLLCTSMEFPLEHFYTTIESYRQSVYKILKEINIDPQMFEKQQFEERLKIDAMKELIHVIVMTNIVECREGEDYENNPPNKYTVRRWKRVFEIFEEKGWF